MSTYSHVAFRGFAPPGLNVQNIAPGPVTEHGAPDA
jgi:hypothetical protein